MLQCSNEIGTNECGCMLIESKQHAECRVRPSML